MSTLEVNKITPSTGTSITLGDSGDTFTIPSGVTITNNGTQTGFGGNNTPAFRAFHNTTQNVSNTTLTTLSFNSETFDSDGKYDTSNGRFTPAEAGKYVLFANVRTDDTNTYQFELEIRTSAENAIVKCSRTNTNQGGNSYSAYTIADLSADEYAFVTAYHNQGGTRTLYGGTAEAFFGGFKLIGA